MAKEHTNGFTFYPRDWWTSTTFIKLAAKPILRYYYLELLFLLYVSDGAWQEDREYFEIFLRVSLGDKDWETLKSCFELTKKEGKIYWSHPSVDERFKKIITARENGLKGGRPTGLTNKENPTVTNHKTNKEPTEKPTKTNSVNPTESSIQYNTSKVKGKVRVSKNTLTSKPVPVTNTPTPSPASVNAATVAAKENLTPEKIRERAELDKARALAQQYLGMCNSWNVDENKILLDTLAGVPDARAKNISSAIWRNFFEDGKSKRPGLDAVLAVLWNYNRRAWIAPIAEVAKDLCEMKNFDPDQSRLFLDATNNLTEFFIRKEMPKILREKFQGQETNLGEICNFIDTFGDV